MAGKAKIPDPLSEIAQNIVALLESHRAARTASSELSFLNWSQIVASLSGVNPDWVHAALSKPPAKGNVLIAVPEDLKSPVALKSDVERLAMDSAVLLRLVQHPASGCSELNPVRPVSELCKAAEKSLRKPIEAYWSKQTDKFPPGLAAVIRIAGKQSVVQIHDERFARPDAVLSQRLVSALESLKAGGDSKYPAMLSELLLKAGIEEDDPLLPAAMLLPPFSQSVGIVGGRLPAAWLTFRAEAQSAVNTDGFLKRLLTRICSSERPEVRLSAVCGLLAKDVQARVGEVWRTHADLQRRFPFVELQAAGSKSKPDLILRDARFPRAEKILSEQLVKTLETARSAAAGHYPMSLARLHEMANPSAETGVFQKAIALEPFASRAKIALPGASDSPVALTDDIERLAAFPALLDAVVGLVITAETQAVAIDRLATLKAVHVHVRPHFEEALKKAVSEGRLPPGFGAVRLAGKWHVFRTRDVLLAEGSSTATTEETKPKRRAASSAKAQDTSKPPEPVSESSEPPTPGLLTEVTAPVDSKTESPAAVESSPAASGPEPSTSSADPMSVAEPTVVSSTAAESTNHVAVSEEASSTTNGVHVHDFEKELHAAFDHLSASSRLPGCVSLADLRPALQKFPRDVFDNEIIRLRKSGEYSLSIVEGRYPLSDTERDACLIIDNTPHLLIRRRDC
ncbi:MAG: hypothetical protein ACK58L_16235 [Planctomycetota bacterium]